MATMERLIGIGGKAVPDGFSYASDTNDRWLTCRECEIY